VYSGGAAHLRNSEMLSATSLAANYHEVRQLSIKKTIGAELSALCVFHYIVIALKVPGAHWIKPVR
jgi:hypothetical protein